MSEILGSLRIIEAIEITWLRASNINDSEKKPRDLIFVFKYDFVKIIDM